MRANYSSELHYEVYLMEFRLPALGEGIEQATVTGVLVKPGDTIKNGQPVLSVETDKASMEVEADVEGVVEQILVKPGDKIPVGSPLLKLTTADAPESAKPTQPAKADTQKQESSKSEKPKPQSPPVTESKNVEFRLPPLGEGIETATVTALLVKPGDVVKMGQPVLSVETDKASMDVESDVEGVVQQILIKPGGKLGIGTPVMTLSTSSARAEAFRQHLRVQPRRPDLRSRVQPRQPHRRKHSNCLPHTDFRRQCPKTATPRKRSYRQDPPRGD